MEGKKKFQPDRKLKLMDQVRLVLRYHHYSYRIEKHTATGSSDFLSSIT